MKRRSFVQIACSLLLYTQSSFCYSPLLQYTLDLTTAKTPGFSALSALSKLALPIPSSAYNGTQVAIDKQEFDNFNWLNYDLQWWELGLSSVNQSYIETYQSSTGWQPDGVYGPTIYNLLYGVQEELNYWVSTAAFPGNASFEDYGTWLVGNANRTNDLKGEIALQSANVTELSQKAYYRVIGDYMGVGINVRCQANVNNTLSAASEWDKAGSGAATTLMALLPVLLTFGNLYVPRSSEVFCTSFLVGFMSAVFGFGLPVQSISGIRRKQNPDISTFGFYGLQAMRSFGKVAEWHKGSVQCFAQNLVTIAELQKWSKPAQVGLTEELSKELEESNLTFSSIKNQVMKWQRRSHYWLIPNFLIFAVQLILFVVVVAPLFVGFGTPLLLFDCSNLWTAIWLIISGVLSGVARFVMWQSGHHERLKIYALSTQSIASLRNLVASTTVDVDLEPRDMSQHDVPDVQYRLMTTETELPPLESKLAARIIAFAYHCVMNLFYKAKSIGLRRGGSSHSEDQIDEFRALRYGPKEGGRSTRTNSELFDSVSTRTQSLWTHTWAAVSDPLHFFKHGVRTHKPNRGPRYAPTGAMRYRPLYVLLHLSTAGRNPLVTLFTGFVEGVILLVLTIFFGAQWGGNLLVVFYVTAVLLITVTLGRALGLFHVWYSSKIFGLHVVECEDSRQIRGCLRIICSMTEVLVQMNGAYYFEGHRLDERDGWKSWRRTYDAGGFDDIEDWNKPKKIIQRTSASPGGPQGIQDSRNFEPQVLSPVIQSPKRGHFNRSRARRHSTLRYSLISPDPPQIPELRESHVELSDALNSSSGSIDASPPLPLQIDPYMYRRIDGHEYV